MVRSLWSSTVLARVFFWSLMRRLLRCCASGIASLSRSRTTPKCPCTCRRKQVGRLGPGRNCQILGFQVFHSWRSCTCASFEFYCEEVTRGQVQNLAQEVQRGQEEVHSRDCSIGEMRSSCQLYGMEAFGCNYFRETHRCTRWDYASRINPECQQGQ